jgi:CcmD family protein
MPSRGIWKTILATLLLLSLPMVISPATAAQSEQDSMTGQAGISAMEERRLQHLFWAYNAIWLLLGAYVVSLGVRLRSVNRELARIEEHLRRASSSTSAAS